MVIFVIAALHACAAGWLYAPPAALRQPHALRAAHRHRVPVHGGGGGAGQVWGALVGGVITVLKQWLQDILPKCSAAPATSR
jgi:branched-chain amino acid transport system permease protein